MSGCAAWEYTLNIRIRDALSMKVINPDTDSALSARARPGAGVTDMLHRSSKLSSPSRSPMRSVVAATAYVVLSLSLFGCGNKGDLYLNEIELSEEQQRLLDELDELDDEAVKKKRSGDTATPE